MKDQILWLILKGIDKTDKFKDNKEKVRKPSRKNTIDNILSNFTNKNEKNKPITIQRNPDKNFLDISKKELQKMMENIQKEVISEVHGNQKDRVNLLNK